MAAGDVRCEGKHEYTEQQNLQEILFFFVRWGIILFCWANLCKPYVFCNLMYVKTTQVYVYQVNTSVVMWSRTKWLPKCCLHDYIKCLRAWYVYHIWLGTFYNNIPWWYYSKLAPFLYKYLIVYRIMDFLHYCKYVMWSIRQNAQ